MKLIDNAEIIAQARQMRAEEIRRAQGQIGKRMSTIAGLAAKSLTAGLSALAELIRPFFTWNPQAQRHS